jgi:hypothetical protein
MNVLTALENESISISADGASASNARVVSLVANYESALRQHGFVDFTGG